MKKSLILLLIISLFAGCEREKYGNVRQKIKCTSVNPDSNKKSKSQKGIQELRYTQFGDFITSITPTSFIGEFAIVRFFSIDPNDNFIALVGGITGDEGITADFCLDSTISVIPELCCNVYQNPDGQGGYFKNEVTLKYLYVSMGLEVVIELPAEYNNVFQTNIITRNLYALNSPVEELREFGQGMNIYFGQTDSTFISYDPPFPNFNTGVHIRSDRFDEWTLIPPLEGQDITVLSTLGFIIDDIIHVYAGLDNIPYTSDDVIVFEPKFWERIYVNVNISENYAQ